MTASKQASGAPKGKAAAKKKAPNNWPKVFLAALAETSNVTQSAEQASISLSTVYTRRRTNREFREQWHTALCEGYDFLEMDVLRRLRAGDLSVPEGGKFDFGTALRILSAHRVTVGAERARQSGDREAVVLASITAKIEAFRRSKEAAQAKEATVLIEQSDAAS